MHTASSASRTNIAARSARVCRAIARMSAARSKRSSRTALISRIAASPRLTMATQLGHRRRSIGSRLPRAVRVVSQSPRPPSVRGGRCVRSGSSSARSPGRRPRRGRHGRRGRAGRPGGVVRLVRVEQLGVEVGERGQTVVGPRSSPTAIARFIATTAFGRGVELVVEGDDLRPVGGLGGRAHRRARRRSPPGAGTVRAGSGAGRPARARGPRRCGAVPPRAVLVGEAHHRAVGGVRAGRRASVSSIRASRPSLGLVGHQLDEDAAEPDRLAGQVDRGRARRPTWRCGPR